MALMSEDFFLEVDNIGYKKQRILCCYQKYEYTLGQNAQKNIKIKKGKEWACCDNGF